MSQDYLFRLYSQAEMLVNRIDNILRFKIHLPNTYFTQSYYIRLNALHDRAIKRAIRRVLLVGEF